MTNTAKYGDKSKWVYSGYRIGIDGKHKWNFDNDFVRNVVIFGADYSLSSHTDILKNDFLNFR